MLITLDDGRVFPEYDGKPLAWDVGAYFTASEQNAGYPRMRAVILAMQAHRPEQLERERRDMLKGSFDRLFGHNARRCLAVIEDTMRAYSLTRGN